MYYFKKINSTCHKYWKKQFKKQTFGANIIGVK